MIGKNDIEMVRSVVKEYIGQTDDYEVTVELVSFLVFYDLGDLQRFVDYFKEFRVV